MENKDLNTSVNKPRRGGNGRIMAGLLLIVIGAILLVSQMKLIFLPNWLFSWQMIPILIGLFIGFEHSFRKPGWVLPVLLGLVFLVDEYVPGFSLRAYIWPIVIIIIGLWVMLRPKSDCKDKYQRSRFSNPTGNNPGADAAFTGGNHTSANHYTSTDEEYIDSAAVFGGVKKSVFSKNFKGGEVVSVFGGTELDLSQADIQHPIVLDTTQIFGGTKLIVPPNWLVKSEVVAILGGVDDKRGMMPGGYDPNKVLILKGVALFGGLDIKRY